MLLTCIRLILYVIMGLIMLIGAVLLYFLNHDYTYEDYKRNK